MKPVIGITCSHDEAERNFFLRDYYIFSIQKAGGLLIILPSVNDETVINEYINCCHGLIFSGGGDIDPSYWGELPEPGLGTVNPLRDSFEMALAGIATVRMIPVLGICRGCQLLNVSAGGSLIQDLTGDMNHQQDAPRNQTMHGVFIKGDTLLSRIIKNTRIRVNSFHHQAVKRPGRGLRISAYASDGVIEAIESISLPFHLGIQWHPECLEDTYSDSLFAAFVKAAADYKQDLSRRVNQITD
ncbi:MAG: gamma-glutamyl-gamma-aminobutyrate hydrolase family protein [Syntrophomonadaceae bacterium]